MTTDSTNTDDATRRDASACNEGLGPLPEPMGDYPEPGERTYTESALLAFGRQERAAERERWADTLSALLAAVRAQDAVEGRGPAIGYSRAAMLRRAIKAAEAMLGPNVGAKRGGTACRDDSA